MTPDQQLFEKVKRADEELWNCKREAGAIWYYVTTDRPQYPHSLDFTTPEGFFWLWERVTEKIDWYCIRRYLWEQWLITRYGASAHGHSVGISEYYINPIKFRAALVEFWGIKEAL